MKHHFLYPHNICKSLLNSPSQQTNFALNFHDNINYYLEQSCFYCHILLVMHLGSGHIKLIVCFPGNFFEKKSGARGILFFISISCCQIEGLFPGNFYFDEHKGGKIIQGIYGNLFLFFILQNKKINFSRAILLIGA